MPISSLIVNYNLSSNLLSHCQLVSFLPSSLLLSTTALCPSLFLRSATATFPYLCTTRGRIIYCWKDVLVKMRSVDLPSDGAFAEFSFDFWTQLVDIRPASSAPDHYSSSLFWLLQTSEKLLHLVLVAHCCSRRPRASLGKLRVLSSPYWFITNSTHFCRLN